MAVLSREYSVECVGGRGSSFISLDSLDLRDLDGVRFPEDCERYRFMVLRNVPALTAGWIARVTPTFFDYCERNGEGTLGEAIRGDERVRELFLEMWGV